MQDKEFQVFVKNIHFTMKINFEIEFTPKVHPYKGDYTVVDGPDGSGKSAIIEGFLQEAKAHNIIKDTSKADTSIFKFSIDKKGEFKNKKKTTLKELENALNKFAGTPTKLTKNTIKSLKEILGEDMKVVVG